MLGTDTCSVVTNWAHDDFLMGEAQHCEKKASSLRLSIARFLKDHIIQSINDISFILYKQIQLEKNESSKLDGDQVHIQGSRSFVLVCLALSDCRRLS
jgi:hypothetical protein